MRTTLALLAILATSVIAQDSPESVADRALAAFRSEDAEALKKLAAMDQPDFWLVADELCARAEFDAAAAFAKAASTVDAKSLPKYVESRRGGKSERRVREALAAAVKAWMAKDPGGALAALEGVESPGDGVVSVRIAQLEGLALRALNRLEESSDAFHRAAEVAMRLGWLRRATLCYDQSGLSAAYRSDFETAKTRWESLLAVSRKRGHAQSGLAALSNIGNIHRQRGNLEAALECLTQALALARDSGDRRTESIVLQSIGAVHLGRTDYPRALEFFEQALAIARETGDRHGVASITGNIAAVCQAMGDLERALALTIEARDGLAEMGDHRNAALALVNLGMIQKRLGDYAQALNHLERGVERCRELGLRQTEALAHDNIGSVYEALHEGAKALEHSGRALAIYEAIGDPLGIARATGCLGRAHMRLGDYEKALELLGLAREKFASIGTRSDEATTLCALANIHHDLGDYDRALELHKEARTIYREIGERTQANHMTGNIAGIHYRRGELEKAIEVYEESLREAEALGMVHRQVVDLQGLAAAHLCAKRPRKALDIVRQAVERLPGVLRGLSEEHGGGARGSFSGLFEVGVAASLAIGGTDSASFFLESGRAGALLESFGGREALHAAALPASLLEAETAARARETASVCALRRALDAEDEEGIRAARAVLEAARTDCAAVLARIQREAKAAAGLLYPRPAPPDRIRESLRPDEALVLYGLFESTLIPFSESVALVVTAKGARIVRLGETALVSKACDAIRLESAGFDPESALAALRKLVIEPLELQDGIRRVLLSPDGPIGHVPFAALLPERELVCVPSGTTHVHLLEGGSHGGEGVLALGNPSYGEDLPPVAAATQRAGDRLRPLPHTADEARAVGSVVLLGKEATEAGLRDAAAERPWRAVHLACHGFLDPESPMRSSLALTPHDEDDGFLTVMEVFRMKLSADLVVLSACQTGRGKVAKAEGIQGFTRAFLVAGASRVLVSLWKVDDAATKALMVKFYELWNPQEGKGLPAPAALRQAQRFVRSQKKWEHPYYWAAWVLWGLPS